MRMDAFLLGAPKCGTTSLSTLLRRHPGVCFSRPKELGYLCTDFADSVRRVTTEEEYRASFAHHRPGQIRMEGTIYYLYSRDAAPAIHERWPDAKCIVMLRNPVDMAYSLHDQLLYNCIEHEDDFRRAWALQEDRRAGRRIPPRCREPQLLLYSEQCRLGEQLARLYACIPREQVLPVLLEDYKADPNAVLARTQDFLGLERRPPEAETHANPPKARRLPALGRFLIDPPAAVDVPLKALKRALGIRTLGIGAWYDRHMRRNRPRPPLDPDFRRELEAHFADDVALLERLLDRPLSAWRTDAA